MSLNIGLQTRDCKNHTSQQYCKFKPATLAACLHIQQKRIIIIIIHLKLCLCPHYESKYLLTLFLDYSRS